MDDLPSGKKVMIAQEIREAVANLIRGCETLDMELAFDIFYDSPNFLMIGTDGTFCDYETYLKNNIEYLKTCASFELTTLGEKIKILNNATAVYSWSYRAEATLMTGEKDIVDRAGATFVFQKINDEWKVVYYHESSVPPKRKPPIS